MNRRFAAALAVAAMLCAGSAHAITQTNNMNVDMSVYTPTTCTISAGGTMDFGTYLTNSATGPTAQTNVIVACTANRAYNLYPDNGLHYVSNYRTVADAGTNRIPYYLYKDASLVPEWNSSNRYYGTGTGVSETFPVYGYLGWGALPSNGTADGVYNDTVTMIVEYTP